MPLFVKPRSFLRNLFLSRRVEADLDQEVHSHLEMLIEENIRAGMQPKDAQRAARIELGGIEQVKEQVREERLGNWLPSVIFDCRYGLRQLRKNPGFTAVAVLTLALGIGATTAIFSVVYGVLLRPLPYPDPNRIMAVFEVTSKGRPSRLADPNFDDFRDQNRSFQAIAKYTGNIASVSGASQPTRTTVAQRLARLSQGLRYSADPRAGFQRRATRKKGPAPPFSSATDTGGSISDRRRISRSRT